MRNTLSKEYLEKDANHYVVLIETVNYKDEIVHELVSEKKFRGYNTTTTNITAAKIFKRRATAEKWAADKGSRLSNGSAQVMQVKDVVKKVYAATNTYVDYGFAFYGMNTKSCSLGGRFGSSYDDKKDAIADMMEYFEENIQETEAEIARLQRIVKRAKRRAEIYAK